MCSCQLCVKGFRALSEIWIILLQVRRVSQQLVKPWSDIKVTEGCQVSQESRALRESTDLRVNASV